jgi:hypothetical protein
VLFDAPFNVTAFGEDEAGEVYVTEYRGGNPPPATSKVHRLELAPGSGGPDLAAAPNPLDYGNVEVGDTVTGILTLSNANTGPEALILDPAALSDPVRFALDLSAGGQPCQSPRRCLPPGASCTIGVALRAEAPATIAETLAFDGTFAAESVQLAAEVVPCSTTVTSRSPTAPSTGREPSRLRHPDRRPGRHRHRQRRPDALRRHPRGSRRRLPGAERRSPRGVDELLSVGRRCPGRRRGRLAEPGAFDKH